MGIDAGIALAIGSVLLAGFAAIVVAALGRMALQRGVGFEAGIRARSLAFFIRIEPDSTDSICQHEAQVEQQRADTEVDEKYN
jgi:hypothetical protein